MEGDLGQVGHVVVLCVCLDLDLPSHGHDRPVLIRPQLPHVRVVHGLVLLDHLAHNVELGILRYPRPRPVEPGDVVEHVDALLSPLVEDEPLG